MNQFWKDVLDNAALILGLAVSLNILGNALASQVLKRRQLRMLVMDLQNNIHLHLFDIHRLSEKVGEFIEGDMPKPIQQKLPALTGKAKDSLVSIVKQADAVLISFPKIDPYHLANFLNGRQLTRLMDFLEDYQLYRARLDLRLRDYKVMPDRGDVLGRFLSSADLDEGLDEKFDVFKKSVKVKRAKK